MTNYSKVFITFSEEASSMLEETNQASVMESSDLQRGYDWDIKEFNSEAESEAYIQGINDASGWNYPSAIILQEKVYQVHSELRAITTHAYELIDRMNKQIGRKAFSCKTTEVSANPFASWIVFGKDITLEEIERLELRTHFTIK